MVEEGNGGGGGSPLSAEVLLCRVSHIFSLFAVALVLWLVVLMTLGSGGCVLLPVVAILLVGPRCPGLEREHTHRKHFFFITYTFSWDYWKKYCTLLSWGVFNNIC